MPAGLSRGQVPGIACSSVITSSTLREPRSNPRITLQKQVKYLYPMASVTHQSMMIQGKFATSVVGRSVGQSVICAASLCVWQIIVESASACLLPRLPRAFGRNPLSTRFHALHPSTTHTTTSHYIASPEPPSASALDHHPTPDHPHQPSR